MADDLHSDDYRSIVRALRQAREASGIQQGELSKLIGKPRNFINRVEMAERRLGFVDFVRIANALGQNPADLFGEVIQSMERRAAD